MYYQRREPRVITDTEWLELLRLIEDSKSVEELRSRVVYQDIKRRFWV